MKDLNIISLEDARRLASKRAFSTLVKPAGAACNLRCKYCYYIDKSSLLGSSSPGRRMELPLLEKYIADYFDSVQSGSVDFCWHGGEPLLLGLDYFRAAVRLQRKLSKGREYTNSLQTNGTLLNAEWCRFFRENGFLVGLSVDGPPDIQDASRVNAAGRGSSDAVRRAASLLRDNGVEFNTLTVLTSSSEHRAAEVYEYLTEELGSRYLQFLPAVDFVRGADSSLQAAPWNISARGYGDFMCSVFDLWVKKDVGRVFVQLFDVTLAQTCGLKSTLCTLGETCGDGLCVEHNGNVYTCDHFVDSDHLLGNISGTSLGELYDSPGRLRFALDKRNLCSPSCLRCEWWHLCHGGCPGHRIEGRNCLCEGLRMFFSHSREAMSKMRLLLLAGRAPAEIMYGA